MTSGVNLPQDWAGFARRVEELGYSSLTLPDHLDHQLAPVPALAAAAMVTRRLQLGAMVWCNDFRHPAMLAKELATLDVLSQGRLQLGLGAGWLKSEYDRAGLVYDPPGVRIERMAEGLEVIRGLFSEGPYSYEGKHYRIRELDGLPKPVQARVPIFIGGGGRRMLTLAGREADIVGLNLDLRSGEMGREAIANAAAAASDEKIGWVREAAGPRWDSLELSTMVFATEITDDASSAWERLSEKMQQPVETLVDSPHVLVGTVDEIVATLVRRRERWGLSYIVVRAQQVEEFAAVVERLRD